MCFVPIITNTFTIDLSFLIKIKTSYDLLTRMHYYFLKKRESFRYLNNGGRQSPFSRRLVFHIIPLRLHKIKDNLLTTHLKEENDMNAEGK